MLASQLDANEISYPRSPSPTPLSASEGQSEAAGKVTSPTSNEDSSDAAPTDPGTSTAPVDPDGDSDASASNTTDVHPL